jgi:hypothetical protein
MERFRTEEDGATEGIVGANTSRSAKRQITHQKADPDDEMTCEALHLALSAIHLDIAWHAGVMTVDAAMESLHKEIVETVGRYARSNRTIGPEISNRSSMPAAAMRSKNPLWEKYRFLAVAPVVRRRLNQEERDRDGRGQRRMRQELQEDCRAE